MKLKLLRQHYQSNDNKVWTPKTPFESEDEIKEKLGIDSTVCNIYKCEFCNFLHVATFRKRARRGS